MCIWNGKKLRVHRSWVIKKRVPHKASNVCFACARHSVRPVSGMPTSTFISIVFADLWGGQYLTRPVDRGDNVDIVLKPIQTPKLKENDLFVNHLAHIAKVPEFLYILFDQDIFSNIYRCKVNNEIYFVNTDIQGIAPIHYATKIHDGNFAK